MNVDAIVSSVAVSGGALRCVSAGRGRALVLLHGWTLDARMWAPQFAGFSATHHVIAPDRRGFGRSTAPPDLARESEDVLALLDHFGAANAVIVGMSQSGRTALDLALRHPDRVAALVLQGARFGADDAPEIPVADYAALVRGGRLEEMKRRWRVHPLMRAMTPEAQACADDMLHAYDGRDLLADAPPASPIGEAEAAHIAAPTLLLTGEHDTPGRRAAASRLAQTLPRAAQVDLAGAGHFCNLCRPDAYNAALARFLAALG